LGRRINSPARLASLPCGRLWRAKLTTSDDLGNFLTHVTTFHDICTSLMTGGDKILTTLKSIGADTLMTPMTSGEDTLTTPVTTHDYLVTTLHDVNDDPCDDIDDQA